MDQSSQTGGHVSDKDLMPWDYITLKQAMAKCNSNIPSLFTLAVESIKAFVNPGIKELEVKLLDDNADKLTHNNDLRCIAEQNIEQQIRDLSDQLDTVQAYAEHSRERQRQHKEYIVDLVNEVHGEIIECVHGEFSYDKKLYQRVKDIESKLNCEMERIEIKIDSILELIEPAERKRRDRNQRKRERERERRENEENKKSKI